MRTIYIILSLCFFTLSCKPTLNIEKEFKERIRKDYPNVCFKKDESNRIMTFNMNLFEKGDYTFKADDNLDDNYETNGECEYIALSGKIGDSVYSSVVYPYKKDIKASFKEYPRWFYEAKAYLGYTKNKEFIIDTMGIEHNPPINNPRINEDLNER